MTNETFFTWAVVLAAAMALDVWLLPRLWRNWEQTGRLAAAQARLARWQGRWQAGWNNVAARVKSRVPSLPSAHPAAAPVVAAAVIPAMPASVPPTPRDGDRDEPIPASPPAAAVVPATPAPVPPDPSDAGRGEPIPATLPAATALPAEAAPVTPAPAPAPSGVTVTSLPVAPPEAALGAVIEPHPAPPSADRAPATTRVQVTFDLAPGARVRVTVEDLNGLAPTITVVPDRIEKASPLPAVAAPAPVAAPAARAPAQPARWALPGLSLRRGLTAGMQGVQTAAQRLAAAVPLRFRTLDVTLFALGLLVYLVTRLVGLDRFPIYFFTDEAVHTVLAANFVRDGFQNSYGEFLPTYFSLGSSFGLNSISVYVQVLPYLLFGKSIFVTRATSALITLLGTAAVALTLRDVFKVRYWWTAVLLLAITPTWFMHSRTAFEYAEVAAFYGGFIYFYLRYRSGSPRALYGAVVLGALVFYTHGLGEILIGSTALILFIIDLPYHLKNRGVVGRGLVLAVILALPYVRYSLAHGGEFMAQLRQRGSYWTNSGLSLGQKVANFASEYVYGLNPMYWYFPETRDLARHIMKGYGNIWWPTLPFAILGLVQIVRKFRQPAYRVLLVTLLTTPIASALVAIGVLRMLWFLMPITVITGLGLTAVMEWLEQRRWPAAVRSPARALSLGMFVVLAGFSFYMLYDALTNGPVWVRDYTLYGEQYGAKQIFADTIPAYLKRDPNVRFEVSPTWANGTDLFLPFFLSPDQQARVQLRNIDYYLSDKQAIDPNAIQVMTQDEYNRATASGKFKNIQVEQILPYPDGRPGFYFTRLTYADNVDQVFAAEKEARRQLASGQFPIGGQDVTVRYSQIGGGLLRDIFDGNWDTLVRGEEANPFILEFDFPEPRSVTGVTADFGTMDLTMTVLLYPPGSETPVKLSQTWRDRPPDPHVEMQFDNAPPQVSKMRVEILNLLAGDTANIHIREFKVLP